MRHMLTLLPTAFSWVFLVVLLFVSGGLRNAPTVIGSSAGPLLEIFYIATNNKAGAVCLLMFPLVCLVFAGTSVLTTSSRLTFAFARDGGLPASPLWWKIHPRLGVPLNALYLNMVVVVIFGCIFLGSTVAFNAIIAASITALGVSYGIPVALNVVALRRKLPERAFKLPSWLGWTANIIGLASISDMCNMPCRFWHNMRHRLTIPIDGVGVYHCHHRDLSVPTIHPGDRNHHELLHRSVCHYHFDISDAMDL